MASDELKVPPLAGMTEQEARQFAQDIIAAANDPLQPSARGKAYWLAVWFLNRSPTGLTAWVPEGWTLQALERRYGKYNTTLYGKSIGDIRYGTGPTPEDAVKDAAKRIGGTSGE